MAPDRNPLDIEEIYREHKTAYYNYLLKLTGDPSASQDLLHESFLKISAGLDRLRDADHLLQWGYRIVLNTFRDWYRRQAREKKVDPAVLESMADTRYNADAAILAGQDITSRVLSVLDSEEKAIFILSQYKKMNYDEIALSTGISSRTVRRRMKSAAAKTARLLREMKVINGPYCDFRGRG